MLTIDELREVIRNGENSAVEFKAADVRAETVAKEMVALSNTKGGLILLGVSDDGTITGLPKTKKHEEWVMNIARNNIVPAIQIEFHTYLISGHEIAVITVPRGQDKPYQTQSGRFLVRTGTTNRRATQSEMLRLFQAVGAFHFDAIPVRKTSPNDLNLSQIDAYFRRYGFDFAKESQADRVSILINSDILSPNGEVTVGGLLVFGVNPSRYLHQAGITFAHFNGNEITAELIDKQKIEGTLAYQIDTGLAVIKNNWLTPSIIVGTKRVDTGFIFEDKVFRELLTNACVHRNYAILGSQIRVFMFEDRIEFRSPGRLPNTITPEKLKVGVSYSINPILVKFMENLRYIDHLGRGLPMVYREAQKNKKLIEFKEVGEEFWVVLGRR